mmetsp:Transcript_81620/g.231332  ORF Transcript_81620/g.231332 Transcript_81620/m.231332 type:complete len:213 (+) Transcript_81620:1724-2362(+)
MGEEVFALPGQPLAGAVLRDAAAVLFRDAVDFRSAVRADARVDAAEERVAHLDGHPAEPAAAVAPRGEAEAQGGPAARRRQLHGAQGPLPGRQVAGQVRGAGLQRRRRETPVQLGPPQVGRPRALGGVEDGPGRVRVAQPHAGAGGPAQVVQVHDGGLHPELPVVAYPRAGLVRAPDTVEGAVVGVEPPAIACRAAGVRRPGVHAPWADHER